MANDHKTPYAAVFEKAERKLLNRIQDPDTRAQLRQQLPSRSGFKTAAYTAKKQGIPKGPDSIEEIDFEILKTEKCDLEKYILSVAGRQRTKKLGLQIFSLNGSNGQFCLLLHWATTMLGFFSSITIKGEVGITILYTLLSVCKRHTGVT